MPDIMLFYNVLISTFLSVLRLFEAVSRQTIIVHSSLLLIGNSSLPQSVRVKARIPIADRVSNVWYYIVDLTVYRKS